MNLPFMREFNSAKISSDEAPVVDDARSTTASRSTLSESLRIFARASSFQLISDGFIFSPYLSLTHWGSPFCSAAPDISSTEVTSRHDQVWNKGPRWNRTDRSHEMDSLLPGLSVECRCWPEECKTNNRPEYPVIDPVSISDRRPEVVQVARGDDAEGIATAPIGSTRADTGDR